ncbi:uncharacterized protein LY89DRAFT_68586 [Mollisia scopiformis]|uniref:Uncharacterized protein n=1 Tax=Mollisia scopiformis TaxID=149040 RepID=A0A194XA07_MOLSC|nr:uncharacterized protein LY89DRAFT_68586 [Mollisia scopiformis]KUJ16969.1 hypothetical protein LY89DRAFT_68586 [Mollisia scopiformis]
MRPRLRPASTSTALGIMNFRNSLLFTNLNLNLHGTISSTRRRHIFGYDKRLCLFHVPATSWSIKHEKRFSRRTGNLTLVIFCLGKSLPIPAGVGFPHLLTSAWEQGDSYPDT